MSSLAGLKIKNILTPLIFRISISHSFLPSIDGIINVGVLVYREPEGEFSTIKEIIKHMSNGHANYKIQNSVLRNQVENLMLEKPNKQGPVLSKCSVQQFHVTVIVTDDPTLNMIPETRSKTFPD